LLILGVICIGVGEGGINHGAPGVIAETARDFAADARQSLHHELSDVSENGGVMARDAAFGQQGPELGESVIDVADGFEFAGEGDEFFGDEVGIEAAGLKICVVAAEFRIFSQARHGAAAAVGIGEMAAV
jgi:hypothetical protein